MEFFKQPVRLSSSRKRVNVEQCNAYHKFPFYQELESQTKIYKRVPGLSMLVIVAATDSSQFDSAH